MKNVKSLLFVLTTVIFIPLSLLLLSSEPLNIEPSKSIITVEVNESSEMAITEDENDTSGELLFISEESTAPESTEPPVEIEEPLRPSTENEQVKESLIPAVQTTTESLDQFAYKSASVLPIYEENGETYLILTREAYGRRSGVKGTYDDFGGKKEPEDTNPLISAAREFFEEAILDKSLHLTFEAACKLTKEDTYLVIANTTRRGYKHVTYIIDFAQYKDEFLCNFYQARKESTQHINLEKDRIALVKLSDLKQIVQESKNNNSLYVTAKVITQSRTAKTENIKLRPYFVAKLRGFFLDKPYKVSTENEKIRFYS